MSDAAAPEEEFGAPTATEPTKTCFVVSEFGKTPEEIARTKQVLRHLIRKVLEPMGYSVVRADEIDDEGLITHQIVTHLLDDDLVVADLTNHNPNVFYEVAVRHAARKPIVHVITDGESIPFDVANQRAVLYALDNPDKLEEAQDELRRKVLSIEDSGWEAAPNPITAARDVALLKDSDRPELREAGAILEAVADLRSEVRALSRGPRTLNRASPLGESRPVNFPPRGVVSNRIEATVSQLLKGSSEVPGLILNYLFDHPGTMQTRSLAAVIGVSQPTASKHLRALEGIDLVQVSPSRDVVRLRPSFRSALESPASAALAELIETRPTPSAKPEG